jgi:hypothetical protein
MLTQIDDGLTNSPTAIVGLSSDDSEWGALMSLPEGSIPETSFMSETE